MENITLVAPDISCEHCQRAIEDSLGKVGGVGNVKVDIPAKTVLVNYDSQQVTVSKIKAVLDEIGYTVSK